VGHVHRGDRVRIDVPAAGLTAAPGQVVKLGSRATDANAFPLEATLARDTPALRAGMTADVTFTLSPGTDEAGFLLPLSAVRVEAPGQKGWVFVYDSESGTVHRTPVRLGPLHAEEVEVRGGIRPGDRIAAAGVELLRDGQEVRAAEHAP
jgi:multidrug efflux pump subunit AcrA (membrane-fusion protein)